MMTKSQTVLVFVDLYDQVGTAIHSCEGVLREADLGDIAYCRLQSAIGCLKESQRKLGEVIDNKPGGIHGKRPSEEEKC